MIERKAFFISGENLTRIEHKRKIVVIFDMSHDRVVGVETISLEDKLVSAKELLLFLQKKNIHVIYVSGMDRETENLFSKFGVAVKTAVALKNDRLFDSLYFSPPVF